MKTFKIWELDKTQQYVYNEMCDPAILRIAQFDTISGSWTIVDPLSKRLYGELHKLYNWQTLQDLDFTPVEFND